MRRRHALQPDQAARPRLAANLLVGPCDVGRGIFATRAFQPGELILHLAGPRFDRSDPIHLTEAGANLLQTGQRSYIMLQSPGVFANHSCDPNAGIQANRRLVAIRPIAAGDEIRYDYSTTMDEDFWTMACRCGAAGCRGVVTDFRLLPAAVKERYLALGIVQGFIARKERRRSEAPAGQRSSVAAPSDSAFPARNRTR